MTKIGIIIEMHSRKVCMLIWSCDDTAELTKEDD